MGQSAEPSPTVRRSVIWRQLSSRWVQVVLRKGNKTRVLPLEDFFIAYGKRDHEPGEFVLAVETPGSPITSVTAPSRFRSVSTTTFQPLCSPYVLTLRDGASSERALPAAAWRRHRSARRKLRTRLWARA